MLPFVVAPAEPSWLLAAILLAAAGALLLGRALAGVGFRFTEAALLLVAAPLLSASELPWTMNVGEGSILAANAAGFAIPVVVALKFMIEGRVPLAPTLAVLSFATLVAYPSSVAVPDQGILLYYRLPALAAAGGAVAVCWGQWQQAGPVAFVGGAGGVILGADLTRLPELLAAEGARRIVIGGAGVLDGIFIVGILAALLALAAMAVAEVVARLRRPDRAPDASETEFSYA